LKFLKKSAIIYIVKTAKKSILIILAIKSQKKEVMMKTVNATKMKNKFGTYLREVMMGPIFIEKNHNTIAVILSSEEYERLKNLRTLIG